MGVCENEEGGGGGGINLVTKECGVQWHRWRMAERDRERDREIEKETVREIGWERDTH